jgi:hypothetical protein
MESRFAKTSFFPGCKQVLERGHGGQHPREHVKERGYSTTGMNTSTSRNLVDLNLSLRKLSKTPTRMYLYSCAVANE